MKGSAGLVASCLASTPVGCGNPEEYASPADVFEVTFGVKPSRAFQGLQVYMVRAIPPEGEGEYQP